MSIDPPIHQSIFTSVPPVVSRNYAVIDTTYTAPPISNAGYPGPDGTITDTTSGTLGLSSISAEILDELPEDCRRAFEDARAAEVGWKQQWGTEAQSGLRGGLKIGFSGYPV
jgi:chromatin structure-remodeling complex protein RSC7